MLCINVWLYHSLLHPHVLNFSHFSITTIPTFLFPLLIYIGVFLDVCHILPYLILAVHILLTACGLKLHTPFKHSDLFCFGVFWRDNVQWVALYLFWAAIRKDVLDTWNLVPTLFSTWGWSWKNITRFRLPDRERRGFKVEIMVFKERHLNK